MIPRLHLVTDAGILSDPGFLARAGAAISAGGSRIALHLRGPGLALRVLRELGRELVALTGAHGTRLLVDDRVDLALVLDAAGVHLGPGSLPMVDARRILGPAAILGCSVHGVDEARAVAAPPGAAPSGPDFVFAGTLYATPSHPGRPGAGVERIREVRGVLPSTPVLGIGGISIDRVAAVLSAGAHGVAVVRAVWSAGEPGSAVRGLLEAIDACVTGSGA